MMPGESGLDLTESLRREQGQRAAGAAADRAWRAGGPHRRVRGRRGRLPRQAVRAARAGAAHPRHAAPRARRRCRSTAAGPVQLGALVFDLERGELRDADRPDAADRRRGGPADARSRASPNEVLSREEIAAALGMDDSGERAIDVQVTRLRRKIEADPREPRFLHTVRGRGYVLKPGGDDASARCHLPCTGADQTGAAAFAARAQPADDPAAAGAAAGGRAADLLRQPSRSGVAPAVRVRSPARSPTRWNCCSRYPERRRPRRGS